MWAACLGASIALAWYIKRNAHENVMKVAVCSALGAGFGFAFGNFLQVMGNVSGLPFNFWNVMEYSIGFFGGIGMAYGTFTQQWAVTEVKIRPRSSLIPILFIALFIPFVVWDQTFVDKRFDFILEGGGTVSTIFYFKLIAILAIAAVALLTLGRNYSPADGEYRTRARVKEFFLLYFGLYILLSFLVTGILVHPIEQYLYIVNMLVIIYLMSRSDVAFSITDSQPRRWMVTAVISVVVIALLAVIAINSHGEMWGSQKRFGNKSQEQSKSE
jgi:hypothetical protein